MPLFTGRNAAVTGTVLAAWAASHAVGVGEAADAILLVVGVAALGLQAFQGGWELGQFLMVAANAQTDCDLEIASQHLAKAVISLGVATLTSLIMRSGGKAGAAAGGEDALAVEGEAGALANLSAVQAKHASLIMKYLRGAGVSEGDLSSHLSGWNLDFRVYETTLEEGDEVIQYTRNMGHFVPGKSEYVVEAGTEVRGTDYVGGDQAGNYFGLHGATMDGVGINSGFAGRTAYVFRVQRRITVLEGTAAAVPKTLQFGIGGTGGQTQLLIRKNDLISLVGVGAANP